MFLHNIRYGRWPKSWIWPLRIRPSGSIAAPCRTPLHWIYSLIMGGIKLSRSLCSLVTGPLAASKNFWRGSKGLTATMSFTCESNFELPTLPSAGARGTLPCTTKDWWQIRIAWSDHTTWPLWLGVRTGRQWPWRKQPSKKLTALTPFGKPCEVVKLKMFIHLSTPIHLECQNVVASHSLVCAMRRVSLSLIALNKSMPSYDVNWNCYSVWFSFISLPFLGNIHRKKKTSLSWLNNTVLPAKAKYITAIISFTRCTVCNSWLLALFFWKRAKIK